MHLNDCEISTREVRGHQLVILFGARKVTADEGAALLGQFVATHGGTSNPIFASPQGWQILEAAAPAVAPVAEPAPAAEAEAPATEEPAARVRRSR